MSERKRLPRPRLELYGVQGMVLVNGAGERVWPAEGKGVSSGPDLVPAMLSPGRYGRESGDTITCTTCGWSETEPSAARRRSAFMQHDCAGLPEGME